MIACLLFNNIQPENINLIVITVNATITAALAAPCLVAMKLVWAFAYQQPMPVLKVLASTARRLAGRDSLKAKRARMVRHAFVAVDADADAAGPELGSQAPRRPSTGGDTGVGPRRLCIRPRAPSDARAKAAAPASEPPPALSVASRLQAIYGSLLPVFLTGVSTPEPPTAPRPARAPVQVRMGRGGEARGAPVAPTNEALTDANRAVAELPVADAQKAKLRLAFHAMREDATAFRPAYEMSGSELRELYASHEKFDSTKTHALSVNELRLFLRSAHMNFSAEEAQAYAPQSLDARRRKCNPARPSSTNIIAHARCAPPARVCVCERPPSCVSPLARALPLPRASLPSSPARRAGYLSCLTSTAVARSSLPS
jgi:hypothetical protein